MSYIKRRQFLQFAGSALATAGFSQLDIIRQSEQYGKVLGQSTPRKLALLVGINEYTNGIPTLGGCEQDVLLQHELLMHRFGFKATDILTLTSKQATRQGILQAFNEHLIKQAKPGDVVVFHFSGHGSQVQDKDRDTPDGVNGTLVPVDSSLPENGGVVQDIMGHTLFTLMYALQTDNVTMVLDSCHSGGAKRGRFRVRSRLGGSGFLPSPAEFEEQRKWLALTGLSQQEFINKRRQNVAKGTVITAVKRDQFAMDGQFSGFDAGVFTYALTQYLWQKTANESLGTTFSNVNQSARKIAWEQRGGLDKEPEIESNLKPNQNSSIYFSAVQTIPAEAVITDVSGAKIDLWLGGIEAQSLDGFNEKAILNIVDAKGEAGGQVQIESRTGLNAKAKLLSAARSKPKKGTLLQESIRTIPKNLTLKIGLDETLLDSAAITQARAALQGIGRIKPVTGQQETHYVLGSMTKEKFQQLQRRVANLPAVGSVGLFSPTLDGIVATSFGNAGETVNAAVTRLQPQLKSLLAGRIVSYILGNTSTSKVNVGAKMIVADSKKILGHVFTARGINKNTGASQPNTPVKLSDLGIPKLPVGMKVAFQIQNNENVPLYVNILSIDSSGKMDVIFPLDWSASVGDALIQPGKQVLIPESGGNNSILQVSEPLGFSLALIIASTAPLRDSLRVLQTLAASRGITGKRSFIPAVTGDEFLNLTNSLIDDLDRSFRGPSSGNTPLPNNVRGIDVKKLATMSISFEVV
ncbi:peptidase C14 caspase catalytic subunit p20 [Calothrix sp. NIES-4071]|nr:peptidase C14 caspase catalytic subunit p20 [Calothrix sp. NIES-4071]BAZ58162.1 peptidase C14 caspase catalytic subunit p20 [Calothrix sp. NIES-4105]